MEFHRREVARNEQGGPNDPSFFRLTPLQSTSSEFAPALAVTDMTIVVTLDIASRLIAWFPNVWAMCEAGRLDLGRAELLLDAVSHFANEDDIAKFAASMDAYLAKVDDPSSPICTVTRTQIQRAARYRKAKYPQKTEEESFSAAFQKRRLSFRPGEDGMASLSVRHMITDAMTADYRLTLIAKQIRNTNPDETRTLEQLRADIALDLLLGRLEVTATNAQLEALADPDNTDDPDGAGGAGDGGEVMKFHKTGAYARPIINVTVPISTLLGLTETPGLLSGGNVIPPDLVRVIAANPDSTWYRMLTEAARCVELSTTAYKPTGPIWRECCARDQICLWPGCNRPGVLVELDHRTPYPEGETCSSNMGPLCKRHHTVKHARGFELYANEDGSYTWTTPTGHTWISWPPEQPVAEWPNPDTVETIAREELADMLA